MVRPRRIVGVAGAPGSGKSTFARAYVDQVGGGGARAALVPMDGFHLADVSLRALGLLSRKGAPETFDAWGYAALLHRLRQRPPETVYAPGFERSLEQPLAAAIAVPPVADLVVTEGNYLLLDGPEWRAGGGGPGEGWVVVAGGAPRGARRVGRPAEVGQG